MDLPRLRKKLQAEKSKPLLRLCSRIHRRIYFETVHGKQPYLQILDETIHEALPDAERRIAWSMPTYWRGQIIIQFACGKHNISLYVGEEIIEQLAKELRNYKTNKGTIYLPYQMPMPIQLITNVARRCGEANS